jgi:peptidoglycan/LPS O-acetylase OafA/YrhL
MLWLWLFGWLLYKHHDHPLALLAVTSVCLFALTFWSGEAVRRHYGVAVVGCTALLISKAKDIPFPTSFTRMAKYLGDLSYPWYAVHVPVLAMLFNLFPALDTSGMQLLALTLVSVLMLHGINKPGRRALSLLLQKKKPVQQPLAAHVESAV